MNSYVLVALGSALGGVARFWLAGVVGQRFGEALPWGTILVNVTGCFLIGLVDAWMRPGGQPWLGADARQFVMIGILGGYTTFSSFSLQTLTLARDGQMLFAAANVVLSVVLCLAAVWLGHACAQLLHR